MSKPALPSNDSSVDIWRKIPPEEKLELMARAHSHGVAACLLVLAVFGTVAVGLKIPQMFWGAFVGVPFIFQFVAAKSWRDFRPRVMLDYLAARSAARRYAFGTNCQDLSVALMFRGELASINSDEPNAGNSEGPRVFLPVWVSLFTDTVVVMSEQRGGAKLEFAKTLDDRLEISSEGFDEPDTSTERQVTVSFTARDLVNWTYYIKSRHPGALLVFERKMRSFIVAQKAAAEKALLAYKEVLVDKSALVDDDDSMPDSLPMF